MKTQWKETKEFTQLRAWVMAFIKRRFMGKPRIYMTLSRVRNELGLVIPYPFDRA